MKIQSDLTIDPELQRLLEWAKNNPPSEEQLREQRISVAYGNLALHNPSITKDDVRRAASQMRLLQERR